MEVLLVGAVLLSDSLSESRGCAAWFDGKMFMGTIASGGLAHHCMAITPRDVAPPLLEARFRRRKANPMRNISERFEKRRVSRPRLAPITRSYPMPTAFVQRGPSLQATPRDRRAVLHK